MTWFPTHSPSWESARKRGQGEHHRAPMQEHPGSERVYKRRNTDVRQSPLSHHQQRSLRHDCRFHAGGSDGIEDLKLNRGWRITLYRGWTPPCEYGGRVELLRNTGDTTHRDITKAALLRSYQDITFLAGHQECRKNSLLGTSRTLPIMEHFSKCGLHSVSYSVIL